MRSDAPRYDIALATLPLPSGVVDIRTTFPKSGCYDAVTLTLIWQVDWYEWEWNLRYSADFSYVARRNLFALRPNCRDPALAFYHDGKLIKQYAPNGLLVTLRSLAFFKLTSANWHVVWYGEGPNSYNVSGDQLRFSTARRRMNVADHELNFGLQEHYTFNLKTGEIVERRIDGVARAVFILIILPLTVPLVCVFAGRKIVRRIRRGRNRRGFPIQPLRPSQPLKADSEPVSPANPKH